MIKRFACFITTVFALMHCMPAIAEDSMNFDDFAITDSTDADITTETVELNADANVANVGAFDIAGIMLGMPFEDVQTLFFKTKGLYAPRQKDSIIYTIHNDWKASLDYECRGTGVISTKEIETCINTLARNRGLLYASELHLLRENTGEEITVYFTSNATDNKVWRVVYTNDANEQEGIAEKFEKQRENKILSFWQSVLDKYDAPNSGTDKWISSTNSYDPIMTAYYGKLDLVDNGRNASDQAKNIKQARENFKAKPYAF